MKYPLFLLLLLAVFTQLLVNGQNFTLPQLAPKSPNIAALDKYGEIPVSLSTGIPQISIPLKTIQVDGVSIPITLSYHCNGFQPREIASWVGYGWNLQVGGSITASVNGLPDMGSSGVIGDYATLRSYYKGQMNAETQYNYFEEVMDQTRDTEFDRYQLSLFDNNISFYYDTLNKVVLSPKSDLKIINLSGGGYKVMDIRGNQFFFEAYEGGSTSDNGDINMRQFGNAMTALLTRIVTVNGRQIRFTYNSYEYNYNINNAVNKRTPGELIPNCGQNEMVYSSTHITQTMKLLDSIVFDGGYVKFVKSGTPRADMNIFNTVGSPIPSLAAVKIVNSSGRVLNQFNLIQSYFGSNNKLKLNAIQEQAGATVGRRWEFTYNIGGSVDFFTNAIDHWGYYNGANNATLLPYANWGKLGLPNMGYADRTSRFLNAKEGVLKTIRYPTGGSTEFDYEPNQLKVLHKSSIDNLSDFLLWPTGTFPPVVQNMASGDSRFASAVGTFTLNTAMTMDFTYYIQHDYPIPMQDAMILFTGPSAGVSALQGAMGNGCDPFSCNGVRSVELPAGTYQWECRPGFNSNTMAELVSNFELTYTVMDTSGLKPPFELPGVRIKKIISRDSTGVNPPMIKEYIYHDSLHNVLFRNIPNYLTYCKYNIQDGFYLLPCGIEYTLSGESVAPSVGSTIEYGKVTELYDSSGRGGKVDYTFMLSNDTKGGEFAQPQVTPFHAYWEAGNLLNKKTYKKITGGYSLVQEDNNSFVSSAESGIMPGMKVGYSAYNLASAFGDLSGRFHRTQSIPIATAQFYQNQSTSKLISNDTIKLVNNFSFLSPVHFQQTQIETFDSKGQSVREKILFPQDYPNRQLANSGDALSIRKLADSNMFLPIEVVRIKKINGIDYVISATLNVYKSDRPVLSKVYALKANIPILLSSFVNSTINSSGVFIKDANYEEQVNIGKYDSYGNVSEMQKRDSRKVSMIYDYKGLYPIAEINGADSGTVAYTSFEAEGSGNWVIGSTTRIANDGFTGTASYQLSGGSLTKSGLSGSVTYLLSYWTKNTNAFTVAGTQGGAILTKQLGSWRCYTHRVNGVTQISLSGTGVIDEVRVHPVGTTMSTWCYEPMVGVISHCNTNNIVVYYEYDELGRLSLMRDQNKNILKKVEYQLMTTE